MWYERHCLVWTDVPLENPRLRNTAQGLGGNAHRVSSCSRFHTSERDDAIVATTLLQGSWSSPSSNKFQDSLNFYLFISIFLLILIILQKCLHSDCSPLTHRSRFAQYFDVFSSPVAKRRRRRAVVRHQPASPRREWVSITENGLVIVLYTP